MGLYPPCFCSLSLSCLWSLVSPALPHPIYSHNPPTCARVETEHVKREQQPISHPFISPPFAQRSAELQSLSAEHRGVCNRVEVLRWGAAQGDASLLSKERCASLRTPKLPQAVLVRCACKRSWRQSSDARDSKLRRSEDEGARGCASHPQCSSTVRAGVNRQSAPQTSWRACWSGARPAFAKLPNDEGEESCRPSRPCGYFFTQENSRQIEEKVNPRDSLQSHKNEN